MRLTLKQMVLFVTTAKFGNLAKPAQTLFLSQSAVSKGITDLESLLGETLFIRDGKQLSLNKQGKKLLPKAIEVVERAEEIEGLFKNPENELTGHLTIGASTTIGKYIISDVINTFMSYHPKVKVSLLIAKTPEIISKMMNFSIDVGFVEDSCHEPDIKADVWKEDKLILFSSPQHAIAKKKKPLITDLEKVNWVLRDQNSSTRQVFEQAISKHVKPINVLLELGNAETIKDVVKKGVGISCLSKATIAEELKNKELVEIPAKNIEIKRNLYQLMHKDKHQTKLLEAFLKACQ